MRTQIGIIGAGPAGLLLAHMLQLRGIDSIVLERHTREYCEDRIRAGVLEHGTVAILGRLGVGERIKETGIVHEGIELRYNRGRHRIDFKALTGSRGITIYHSMKWSRTFSRPGSETPEKFCLEPRP